MTRSTHHPSYQLFLERLRAARKAAGTTQEVLAERLGNHQVFVSKLERGERRMDIIDLHEYCAAAGIDFGKFVLELERGLKRSSHKTDDGKLAVHKPVRKRAGRTARKT